MDSARDVSMKSCITKKDFKFSLELWRANMMEVQCIYFPSMGHKSIVWGGCTSIIEYTKAENIRNIFLDAIHLIKGCWSSIFLEVS
jgi:hypothetical protein